MRQVFEQLVIKKAPKDKSTTKPPSPQEKRQKRIIPHMSSINHLRIKRAKITQSLLDINSLLAPNGTTKSQPECPEPTPQRHKGST